MTIANKQEIPAGKFKAQCLSLLDEVAMTGRELVVTKRGRPVAKVVPVQEAAIPSLLGSVAWEGDVISPIEDSWYAEK